MQGGPHLRFDDEDEREDEQSPRLPRVSNPISHQIQRRNIRKQYAAARRRRKADGATAKAAEKAGRRLRDRAADFVKRNSKGIAIAVALYLCVAVMVNSLSSCTMLAGGGTEIVAVASYPSDDADMLGAEAAYAGMEAELQSYLDNYQSTHDYDEYHFDLDEIEHDPYVLISYLTAWFGGHPWTLEEATPVLGTLFDQQYILTEEVTTETRYRTETEQKTREVINPETGEVTTEEYEEEVEVPYDYTICNVSLENFNLSHLPVYTMSEYQMSLYAMYMQVLGNRPDLFPTSSYLGKYIADVERYPIPPEALSDERFAAMIAEAEKYLGYPYVWGGSSPSTSFDCSGFVSWVINNCGVGWNVGRLGSDGLYYVCTPVSPANARPGDLIFFQKTYDTPFTSHVGIYVGNGMMIHCGDPIRYASIETSYWQAHFFGFGRLPDP